MQGEQTIDITPSPRVLRMLGQIDFQVWQCLAELIDNSVDAFLQGRETGQGAMFPEVNVEVSARQDILAGRGSIKVSDNASGMAYQKLESAVRAGYSGNNSVDKLGLFGMGFNVATARLGNRTEVWTSRAEDSEWGGVRIDFDDIEAAGSFRTPLLLRPKVPAETYKHGTEVIISKLDIDRASYLRTPRGLSATRSRLGRIYNKIMRDIGLKIVVADQNLGTRDFCLWNEGRFVESGKRFGRVPAKLPIERDFGNCNYCDDCWVWLLGNEELCPSCGSAENVRLRARTLSGWIGIQRFFDMEDYGIDLIRNGRIIEERSKHFFSWEGDESSQRVLEYPIDQTFWGGRIVGELNIDFVPLASHQKDSFDRNTREWRMVVEAVRGQGPILQNVRKTSGLQDENRSPLARLHTGYRRGQPAGLRWLVPGDANGKGINTEPQRWADLYWRGEPEYQSDEKWYEAVRLAEEAKTGGRGVRLSGNRSGQELFSGNNAPNSVEPGTGNTTQDDVDKSEALRDYEADEELSLQADLPELPGSPTINVTTQRLVRGTLESGLHIQVAPLGNSLELVYDPNHAFFSQTLVRPVDSLVEELGYQLLQRSAASQTEWPLSRITFELRKRYFASSLEGINEVRQGAVGLLDELLEHYVEALAEVSPLPDDEITQSDREAVIEAVSRRDRAGIERAQEVIKGGLYPKYIGHRSLVTLLNRRPEMALDGRFLGVSYSDVPESLRPAVIDQVLITVKDLLWVADPEQSLGTNTESRSLLARAAASLQLLTVWRT